MAESHLDSCPKLRVLEPVLDTPTTFTVDEAVEKFDDQNTPQDDTMKWRPRTYPPGNFSRYNITLGKVSQRTQG